MRRTFPACCASAAGSAASVPRVVMVMNARRSITVRSIDLSRLLRLTSERRKTQTKSYNDCEPERPHGHLGEMAGGESSRSELWRLTRSRADRCERCEGPQERGPREAT